MKEKSPTVELDRRLSIIRNEFDEVIDVLKEKIQSQQVFQNPDHQDQFIKEINNSSVQVLEKLKELDSIRKKGTELGRNIINNQIESIQNVKNSALNSNDVPKIIHELNIFRDKLDHNYKQMDNINYHHVGITMVGFFLAIFPFYNVLSIALGGYLIYSSDFQGKISGIGMISLAAFMLIVTRIFLWYY